jgi:hypothetical protein
MSGGLITYANAKAHSSDGEQGNRVKKYVIKG